MTTMLPLMALTADMNDSASFNIQSAGSHSPNYKSHQINERKFDRPDICALNKNKTVDNTARFHIVQNSMPLISKKDFIEQWLLKHGDAIDKNEIASDNCSTSSVISDSPRSKRVMRSPFRNVNEIKRFKNAIDRDKSLNPVKCQMDIGSPTQSKENRILNENDEPTEKICRYMTSGDVTKSSCKYVSIDFERGRLNDCSSDLKFHLYSGVISSSPKKIMKQPSTHTPKKIEIQSPDITEVESLAPSSPMFDFIDDCIECESPKKLDIQSALSSPRVMKVRIDSESSDISDPGHDSIMDTDIDKTISQVIDDSDANLSISNNNSECDRVPTSCAECPMISSANSSVSDETFFSQDGSLNLTIIEQQNDIQPSQTISQDYASLQNSDVKNDTIDQDISSGNSLSLRSSKLENSEAQPTVSTVAIKKKRKPKKGSLVGRLQALIVGQTSFLRIWRHQMTQKNREKNSKQCILLKIINCASVYNRQFLVGLVISDTHNLLDKVIQENYRPEGSDMNNVATLPMKTLTILTAPEIVGIIKTKENSALEIYPPWEVIDAKRMVLSVLYFRVVTNNSSLIGGDNIKEKCDEIIEKFDCPCLTANRLVEFCETKFTGVKPNLMQYLFDD